MATAIFWIAWTCIFYVYAGYPLLLTLWSKLARRTVRKGAWEPAVSLVIAMHNEAANAARKLRNCFELDYPPDKLQVIVSLDAPSDGTEALVREYGQDRVEVLCSAVRRGKAVAINRALTVARGEIVVFADARQRFDSRALRALAANFADPSVGAVSGELVLLDGKGEEASDGVGLYWRYEKALRSMEAEIHSAPGATGAIYAVRRELLAPLPAGTVLDDVLVPMRVLLKGRRVVFEPEARAYDSVSESPESEYTKKRRTLMGNYELLTLLPTLLLPWRNPIFVQFISHKVGRLLVPYCLAALLVSNLFLRRGFYLLTLTIQALFYGLACVGWAFPPQRPQQKVEETV